MTNCPNCGAVREPAERRCPYCGTLYPKDRKTAQAVAAGIVLPHETVDEHMSAENFNILTELLARGLITPNQARQRMGLPLR